jgi:ABC-type transport system involved in Fe-S cluster assembly fused permease/ATPase subunit
MPYFSNNTIHLVWAPAMESSNTQTKVSAYDIIIRFVPFLWKDKGFKLRCQIVLALALIPFTIVLNLGLPIIFKEIINQLHDKFNTTESVVLLLIFSYSFIWTIETLAVKFREMVFFRPICHAITDYSITLYKHLLALSLRFHLGRQTGKITTAIESSQLAIAMVITNILFRIAPALIELLVAIVIIGYLYGIFYVGLLITTFIGYVGWWLLSQERQVKTMRNWKEQDSKATARFVDGLLNIETVKYFNRHEYEIETASSLLKSLTNLAMNNCAKLAQIQLVYAGIAAVCLGLSTYYSALDVISHKLILGDFILINSYVILFFSPLYAVSGHIYNTKISLTRIEASTELLMEEQGLEQQQSLPALVISKAEVSFEQVSFGYFIDTPIVKNLTFKIPSGDTVAIVGPSGCGKSTIARLLLRLFDQNSGSIIIDGQNIQACDPRSVRQAIGCVPQDIVLFNNTLRYNLCYGTFNCSDAEVDQIIKITQLQTFIQDLPLGLNTPVGERGLKLSGGERQRIAIARALLKRPSILVLDEATSSLDVKTEKAINESIAINSKNTTALIIAHRLSTIIAADQIIVLDKGGLAEQGTHNQLLQQAGLYAQLWKQQSHTDYSQDIL